MNIQRRLNFLLGAVTERDTSSSDVPVREISKNIPFEGTKCTIVDVKEICSVCEKVAGVASEDRTDPDTFDFVPLEWSADVSATRFLTVTETEFQISALKSGGDTDFPDVLSATTPSQDQSPLRSWKVAGPSGLTEVIPEGVVYLSKSVSAHAFLVSSYFVVLTAYVGYASTFSSTSGPTGHSVAYRVSSPIPLLTTQLAATGVASSSIKSSGKVKDVTRGERESSADAFSCLSQCCLFLVLCWPSCRPDKCRQSSLHMCVYAVH